MFKQLTPTIPMLTPLGSAHAHFIWGNDRLVWFGVFQEDTGENWWWLNKDVRLVASISDEQYTTSPIAIDADLAAALAKHRRRYPPHPDTVRKRRKP